MVRLTLLMFVLLFGSVMPQAQGQGLAGMEPKILDMTRGSWVYFRDYNGQQLIYFTHLEVYRCGIEKVSYSINSVALDREWKLQPCDPDKPNQVTTDQPYIALPLGTGRNIAVQLTFVDGSKSAVVRISAANKLLH